MPVTRSNKVQVPVNSDAYALCSDLSTMADSINAVIRVASQSERDALVKVAGLVVTRTDLGGTIEVCDGTNWFRGQQHAEYTGSTANSANTLWGPGPLTRDASNSINDSFAASPSNDRISVAQAGVYAVSIRYLMSASATGTSWGALVNDANTITWTSADITAGYSSIMVAIPNLYLSAGQNIRSTFISGTGTTLSTRFRVTRLQ